MKRSKKTSRIIFVSTFLVVVIFSILLGLFAKNNLQSLITQGTSNKYSASIVEYDYHLRNNATKYQKQLFKELQDAIKSNNDEEIAYSVAKNFIADFYTWTNKKGTYDVGGLYFVYSPQKVNTYRNAKANFYKYLSYYLEKYSSSDLLEVEDIKEISTRSKTTVILNEESYDAYCFIVSWTYKESQFNKSQFDTSTFLMVYKNKDGRFEVLDQYK